MNKNTLKFLDEISNLDFQRDDSAKKHIKNGDAVESCLREDINNGLAYGAKQFLALCYHDENDGKYYLVNAHDGEPFDDAMDIAKAGRFNMGKDLGAQNSGIPASGLLLNSNRKNTRFGIFSKTKNDGDVGIMVKYINENQHKQYDASDDLKNKLKIIFGDHYDRYNVFYIRSYNVNILNKNQGSGNKSPLICTDKIFHSLSLMCDFKDADVYYVEEFIDTIRPFGVHNKTKCQNDLSQFVCKTFELSTKNVKFVDNSYNETKKYGYDAKMVIHVLLNIRSKGGANYSSELLTKDYTINPRRKVNDKTFKKHNTITYQDFVVAIDKANRLVNEPIMLSSYATQYLDALGVEPIGSHKFDGDEIAENEELKSILDNDYWNNDLSLDYTKYVCKPSVLIQFYIENVKDFSLIGSIDNTFSTNDSRRLHDIQKKAVEKITLDGSEELELFRLYMSKLISKVNTNKFLPCNVDTVTSKNIEIEFIMTEEAMELKKVFGWNCLPDKVGKKVTKLPIATKTQIPLRIKSLLTDDYIESDNVKCSYEGVTIQHTGNGNYGVLVSDLFHYENDNTTKKIYHTIDEHKFSKNYYPKKNANNLNIDGKFYYVNFATDIPIKNDRIIPPSNNNDDEDISFDFNKVLDGRQYDSHDFYRNYDNLDIICKFSHANNALLLNSKNYLIRKLSYNKPDNMIKLWNKVYRTFYEKVVNPIYFNDNNIVDQFELKGNQHKINDSKHSDEKEVLLNFLMKQYISNDLECQKLMDSESKATVENVIDELSDRL